MSVSAAHIVTDVGDYILPDLRHCTVRFLQQVLHGEKLVLRQGQHLIKRAPKWPELAARRIMPIFMGSDQLRQYLPNWKAGQREPDRDFLWTLAHNVQPDFAKRLMQDAINVRAAAALQKKPVDKPQLQLTTNVINELLADPILQSKSLICAGPLTYF